MDNPTTTTTTNNNVIVALEYIWLDADGNIRGKTRQLPVLAGTSLHIDMIPTWSFDGSSTEQADRIDSDVTLYPMKLVADPTRYPQGGCFIVLCNSIAPGKEFEDTAMGELVNVHHDLPEGENPIVGFEQEFFLNTLKEGGVWEWQKAALVGKMIYVSGHTNDIDYVQPTSGPYYCGVGVSAVANRALVEDHRLACLGAGLHYYGMNAEVAPNQWEFQIGIRDLQEADSTTALDLCHELVIARYFLIKLAENKNIQVDFSPKPREGDVNGSGMHTNFSTKAMRAQQVDTATNAIDAAIKALSKRHKEHMEVYGKGNELRMTGENETSKFSEFSFNFEGNGADRGASVRVPPSWTYLEDRRPAANANPYEVTKVLIETIILKK